MSIVTFALGRPVYYSHNMSQTKDDGI